MLRAFVFALLVAQTAPARACDTALLLAIDVSGSIDAGEYAMQSQGLAAALADPEVVAALLQGQVALAVVQWSGKGEQAVTQPWRRMLSPPEIAVFAQTAATLPRRYGSDTAVGQALDFAVSQFPAVADCSRKVIDISGDGQENVGFTVAAARSHAEAAGIEVNAVAIEDPGQSAPITSFYLKWVVTRHGFALTARGLQDYPRAIREKLLRELARPVG